MVGLHQVGQVGHVLLDADVEREDLMARAVEEEGVGLAGLGAPAGRCGAACAPRRRRYRDWRPARRARRHRAARSPPCRATGSCADGVLPLRVEIGDRRARWLRPATAAAAAAATAEARRAPAARPTQEWCGHNFTAETLPLGRPPCHAVADDGHRAVIGAGRLVARAPDRRRFATLASPKRRSDSDSRPPMPARGDQLGLFGRQFERRGLAEHGAGVLVLRDRSGPPPARARW